LNVVRFDAFSASNSVGTYHEENQDSYLTDPENFVFAVADGVGGYEGAKEASSIAVEMLKSDSALLADEEAFKNSILEIHSKIQDEAKRLHHSNMGTTIAAARIFPKSDGGGKMICANVGDSPVLLFSGSDVKVVYTDDSYRESEPGNMSAIVQYLGADCDLDVHVRETAYKKNDVLLLCSDGVTDNLVESPGNYKTLASLVSHGSSAKQIVESAMRAEIKPDDMTVILAYF
jgi:serine/threonine protein phosphatase PrpC